MKIPTELKHKPVIVVEDYENVDGKHAYNSEAKGMSLGLAQWNDRGKVDISAKIWRYTGEKWSRQSEEMPFNRVVDLCILLCRTKQYFLEVYRHEGLYDKENAIIDRIGLQGDAITVKIATDNPKIDEDIKLFHDTLIKEDENLSERLKVLSSMLKEMGY